MRVLHVVGLRVTDKTSFFKLTVDLTGRQSWLVESKSLKPVLSYSLGQLQTDIVGSSDVPIKSAVSMPSPGLYIIVIQRENPLTGAKGDVLHSWKPTKSEKNMAFSITLTVEAGVIFFYCRRNY